MFSVERDLYYSCLTRTALLTFGIGNGVSARAICGHLLSGRVAVDGVEERRGFERECLYVGIFGAQLRAARDRSRGGSGSHQHAIR